MKPRNWRPTSAPSGWCPCITERSTDDSESEFVSHMLGHRPAQRFKVFQCGEKWTVPEE